MRAVIHDRLRPEYGTESCFCPPIPNEKRLDQSLAGARVEIPSPRFLAPCFRGLPDDPLHERRRIGRHCHRLAATGSSSGTPQC